MRYYYCYNENFKEYFYKSIVLHIIICLLLLGNGLINFSDSPLEITNSNVYVPIKLGQVRNTRMKEYDIKMESAKKQEELKKAIEKQVSEKVQKNPDSAPISKTYKPNQLELKSKKAYSKNSKNKQDKERTKSDLNHSSSNIASNVKTDTFSSKKQKNAISMSDISETDGTVNKGNIHEVRFKNDVIEYIKENWNPPDFLLDKNLKITVLIKFNKKGILTHYEIKEYPQTLEYKALVDSIKKLMYVMTEKPLPLAGKKISSDSIIFTFNPMYN